MRNYIKLHEDDYTATYDGNIKLNSGIFIPKEAVQTTILCSAGHRVLYLKSIFITNTIARFITKQKKEGVV